MQTGRETLAGIEQALRELKAQEADLERELQATNRERATLVASRLEALRALAAARTRDALADGVIDDADNLSHQVRSILEARIKTVSQLETRRERAEADREAHVARQDALARQIDGLEDRLDRFAAEAKASLERDPGYGKLALRHADLARMLEQAAAKAEQAARDEQEKGLPYRNDPLFMYLWQRQMGTPAYQASGIVRQLDQWVAGLVRYTDARANYAMLTEIPVRLRAHADDLDRQSEAAKAALDEMLATRTRELAGADLVAELKSARERQAEFGRGLEAITAELVETGSQLALYAKGEDQSYQSAVTAYASFLEREPLRRLISDATVTATGEDDRLVEQVGDIGRRLDEIESGIGSRRRRLDQLSERKLELTRVASNFRRQRYDDVGSVFGSNPGVDDLLQLLLRGAITAAEYWLRMQQQQSWRHRPADPWRRQSGIPPFGGFPGGWGDGNGRSGSAPSGTSGKDFETGGTF